MKLNTHQILTWSALVFACCISYTSSSTLYNTGASPGLYPSYYAASYPSYFAPSYPQGRYLWPTYARVPVATVPAAVPATLPAVPAALPAVPAYKYVTVIPQNAPPHGYSVSYFRKYLTTIPAVPAIPAAIPAPVPAIPAAVPAIPAAVPADFVPRPTLYAGLYPHVHQRAVLPHVHQSAVLPHVHQRAVLPHVHQSAVLPHVHQRAVLPHVHESAVLPHGHSVRPDLGAAGTGTIHPQVQPPYPYRAAAAC